MRITTPVSPGSASANANANGGAPGTPGPPAGAAAAKKPARDAHDSPLRALWHRRAGARPEELDELARAAAALASAPAGGPLGLRAAATPTPAAAAPVAGVVDRMLVGHTRDGLPEVRLDIGVGGWRGTEVRLVAGKHGLEATVIAASEAARRVIEAQLADLARALEARGLHVARLQVATRETDDRQHDDERQRRGERARAFVGEAG